MAHALVPQKWNLPPALRQRLGRTVGRQRVMVWENQILIVAHEVPHQDSASRDGILFWKDGEQDWRSSNGETGSRSLDQLLDRYEKRIDEMEQRELAAKQADEYLPVLEGLAPVSRAARNLYEVLQEARKASPNLLELIDLRDKAYDLSRTAELTYQYAKDSMDVAVVKRAEEQALASDRMAVSAHKLNMMAALFFPLATLSGIFGTTLTDNWSWSESAANFWFFLAGGTVTGILLAFYVRTRA